MARITFENGFQADEQVSNVPLSDNFAVFDVAGGESDVQGPVIAEVGEPRDAFVPADGANAPFAPRLGDFVLGDTDEEPGDLTALDFTIQFETSIRSLSLDMMDYRDDGGGSPGEEATLRALDQSGNLVARDSYQITGNEPDPSITRLGVGSDEADIQSVELIFDNDGDTGVGIDNIAIDEASTPGNDTIEGFAGVDTLLGNLGNDTLFGADGDDQVYGNQGFDEAYGNQGNDLVFGGQGDDLVFGGQNDDQIYGNLDDDQVYGNRGEDILLGGQQNDHLFGGAGGDQIYGNLGDDRIYGNLGEDTLFGGEGSDEFAFLSGDGQDTVADFGDGDTIALQTGINGTDVQSFEDLSITENTEGDVVIELGDDNSVTVVGVNDPGDLFEADFSFF